MLLDVVEDFEFVGVGEGGGGFLVKAEHLLGVAVLCEADDVGATPDEQLESAGKLHARAGAGAMQLTIAAQVSAETLTELLQWTWESTGVVRLQVHRAESIVRQGELAIET